MPQIKFTVTDEAAAYLDWYARNVLSERTADAAARHLMMRQYEKVRRKYRKDDPAPGDLATPATAAEQKD